LLAPNAGLLLTIVFWGSLIPVLSEMLLRWDVLFVAMFRYAMAAVILVGVYYLRERGPLLPPGVSIVQVFQLGSAMAAFSILYTFGVAHAHPVTAAVISACGPVIAGLVSWAVTRSRPGPELHLALALSVAGATIATVDLRPETETFALRGGEFLIMIASASWAWYSLKAQAWLAGSSQLRITSLTAMPAGAVLAAVWLLAMLAGLTEPLPRPDTRDVALFAWITVPGVVLGVMLWNYGVKRLGVVVASMFLNLIPVVAVLVALGFGVRPRAEQLIGGALVIAGLLQAQLRQLGVRRPGARRPR
jgi:drug/metabolite transporter (DMT)-like permease